MNPSDELLRPALELAFAVAVAGARLRPRIDPPPALRAFMRFQKLPATALPVVHKVIEDDDEFRRRVAGVATEELAGRLGVVWLTRAEGWVEEMQQLVEVAVAEQEAGERRAGLAKAEKRRAAAERVATKASADLAVARADLERERAGRREAERRADELGRRLAAREAELDSARSATRAVKDRSANAARDAEAAHAMKQGFVDRIAELEARLEDALADRVAAESSLAEAAGAPRDGAAGEDHGDRPDAGAAADLSAAAGALRDSAGALRQLADALDVTGRALRPPVSSPDHRTRPARAKRARTPRRTPLGIPGGLLGDSDAAAEFLVRRPGVTLLVDGYNVAMLGWPGLALAQQRDASIGALEDLVRRFGTRAVAVFDGADVNAPSGTRARLVRVRFTPAGVTADDAIRELVAGLPASSPVVVATNDQEIVRDVRAAGANVISAEQLLSLILR